MALKLPEPITVDDYTFTFERATHPATHPKGNFGQRYDWADAVERRPRGIHHDQWYFKGAGYSSQISTRIALCSHPALGGGFKIPDDWMPILTKRVADIKADKIDSANRQWNRAIDSQAHSLYEVVKALVEWSKERSDIPSTDCLGWYDGCPVQLAQDTLDAIEVKANESLQRSLSW